MLKPEKFKILFVCMGNICRSPTAAGMFQKLISDAGLKAHVTIDCGGTHAFHAGETPDVRAIAAAQKRGVDISMIRARQITKKDLVDFDLILAMDWDNHALLQRLAPRQYHHKIKLLMSFACEHESAVIPDPYYGTEQDFELVLDYVEDATANLVDFVRRRMAQKAAA